MKKKTSVVPVILCCAMLMAGCGEKTEEAALPVVESLGDETGAQQESTGLSDAQTGDAAGNAGVISEDQAYNAVLNYNKAIDSGIDDEINSDGITEYWDVSTNDDGKIVVLYRSYTAAQIRYYVDPVSGETYVTELVPGTIDEEQKTGESFNARDYLTAQAPADAADAPETAGSSSAPVEYETADGFMGSFLSASDRDLIDTTNDYGVFYRVIYKASLEGDELTACGSMDYRNFKDQDPITISSDVTHVFKVNDSTVYLKGGETDTATVSKEEFAGYLDSRKDSGMYFEVEISGGVVTTAIITN